MPASSRDDAPARRERQRLLSDAGEGRLHGSEDHDIPTERARDQFRRRGRKIPLQNETGAREDWFDGLADRAGAHDAIDVEQTSQIHGDPRHTCAKARYAVAGGGVPACSSTEDETPRD